MLRVFHLQQLEKWEALNRLRCSRVLVLRTPRVEQEDLGEDCSQQDSGRLSKCSQDSQGMDLFCGRLEGDEEQRGRPWSESTERNTTICVRGSASGGDAGDPAVGTNIVVQYPRELRHWGQVEGTGNPARYGSCHWLQKCRGD